MIQQNEIAIHLKWYAIISITIKPCNTVKKKSLNRYVTYNMNDVK